MSYGGRNPKRKHEYTTGPQPRRKRAPRGEETVIALTPLPSGLLIKEFTKQNRLVRAAFQPLSGELVPITDPDAFPEIKNVRPGWEKRSAGFHPYQHWFKPSSLARYKKGRTKSFAGKVKRSRIITSNKTLSKTLQVNGVLYPIAGLEKVYRFSKIRSFFAEHRESTVFSSSSEVYKQIIPILDILNWGGQSPIPDFEDDGPSGGKGKKYRE